MNIIARFLLTVFSLLLVANIVPGIEVESLSVALIVALILGVINVTLKPILFLITLPLTIVTLGLFTFILNALLFWFIAVFFPGFSVEGFLPAFIGALVVSLFSSIGSKVF
ncbi:phage holin family protein [Patescibacteria group bacterium]|nr:phage holin family protein [Patescibacteria group bacterium]MCH8889279.1 phage holin family protein [Patescibacteria group bacterium]